MNMDKQTNEGAVQTAPVTKYEFGDMYVECKCGHEQLVAENVPGGIRFDVYTTDKHDIALMCSKCGAKLRLFFKEAANPPQPKEEDGKDSESTNEPTEVQESNDKANEDGGTVEQGAPVAEEKEVNNEPVPKTNKAEA